MVVTVKRYKRSVPEKYNRDHTVNIYPDRDGDQWMTIRGQRMRLHVVGWQKFVGRWT